MKRFLSRISLLSFLVLLAGTLCAENLSLPGDFHKAYITGTITAYGQSVGGAQVIAMGDQGEAITMAAGNGNYSLGVGEGSWKVIASKSGYLSPPPIAVQVSGDETRDNINFDLTKSTAYIEGVVVNESRAPLPYAMVIAMKNMFAEPHDRSNGAPMMSPGTFPTVRTDKEGRFTLQVMAGHYLVSAYKAGYILSKENPHPTIPGLENVPPQYLERMSAMSSMGVPVDVAENETKSGIVIIMAPHEEKSVREEYHSAPRHDTVVIPEPNVLVGKGCLTPNNVLHWTRSKESDHALMAVVVRSTKPFGHKPKGEMVTFKFPYYPYGEPSRGYYSFTDSTAKSGVPYYYAVYEIGTTAAGPYSNAVEITTP